MSGPREFLTNSPEVTSDDRSDRTRTVPSAELLSHAVNGRSHLDLTGKVKENKSCAPALGGYADVYRGNYTRNGKNIQVAIKRLRVHVEENRDVIKVKVLNMRETSLHRFN